MTRPHHPLRELLLMRYRELARTPEVIFWVYGFPILLAVGLGLAFSGASPERIPVDIQEHPQAAAAKEVLDALPEFAAEIHPAQECALRLRLGKSAIVVAPGDSYTYVYDPTRPESALARARLDEALQRAAGRNDAIPVHDRLVTEPGARYIDFLIPGLLGMNLMGGGLWGVGFVLVDMRVRKLLKRFRATPMKRSHFLMSLVGGRLLFTVPEVAAILGTGMIFFDVRVRGSLASIVLVSLLGAICFAGLGLLVACRAAKIETVSGLMNLVMLPMWLLSGIFFASERFPEVMQPFIQALPLTQLNGVLRSVILEGASLASQSLRLTGLAIWSAVSFALALRWFRWN